MKDITPPVDDVFKSSPPRRTVTPNAIRQVRLMSPDDPAVNVLADMAMQAIEERDTERALKHAALDIAHRHHVEIGRFESRWIRRKLAAPGD